MILIKNFNRHIKWICTQLFCCLLFSGFSASANADKGYLEIETFDLGAPRYQQLPSYSYHQTTDYTCGPAAVMELLHYYGKLNDGQMNRGTELSIAQQMGATGEGTSADQVISWLQTHGFRVELGHKISYDILMQNINRGIPTIVAIEHHWTLATGYYSGNNFGNDNIIFTDSYLNRFMMNREQIDNLWLGDLCRPGTCNNDVGDYIVAIPSGQH